jgi:transposase
MKAISQEIRELIIAAGDRGENKKDISIWFSVSIASVYNIINLGKAGNITPKPIKGRASLLTEDDLTQIKNVVAEQNDITLEEIIEKLNLPIKKSRLSKILISMNLTFKKRRLIPTHKIEKTLSKNAKNGVKGNLN